jgi:hypothetical protein
MPADERCETCAQWMTPVDEGRRICRKFGKITNADHLACGWYGEREPLPFDDEPVEEE